VGITFTRAFSPIAAIPHLTQLCRPFVKLIYHEFWLSTDGSALTRFYVIHPA
jgi:hypothetical protein